MGLKQLLGKLGKAVDAAASPDMIQALSPTEGLDVKPHTFHATEQEGRWKRREFWRRSGP